MNYDNISKVFQWVIGINIIEKFYIFFILNQ